MNPDKETLDRWQRTITEAADAMVKSGTKDAALLGFLRMTAATIAEQPVKEEKRRQRRDTVRKWYYNNIDRERKRTREQKRKAKRRLK